MKRRTEHFGAAEEHTSLGRRVDLSNRLENHIPVGATEVGGRAETGNGILFGVGVVDHNVGCVVGFDFGGQVGVDLDMVVQILGFNGEEERAEPFKGSEISANPEEVDLSESSAALGVVHAVPDTLEDGSEGRYTDTGTYEDSDFEFEHILGCGTEGAIDVDSGKNLAEGKFIRTILFTFAAAFEAAAQRLSEGLGEITNHTHVDGNVIFLGSTGEREGMVLPDGDLGTAEEDVLMLLASCSITQQRCKIHT